VSPIVALAIGFVILFLYFAAFWVLQRAIRNSAVVDVGWAMSVALVGVFYCLVGGGSANRRWLVAILICGWAIRLSLYLYNRWRQHAEDERYTALKDKWGDQAQARMFRFYQMQAVGAFIFSWPVLVVANLDSPLCWLDYLAVIVWPSLPDWVLAVLTPPKLLFRVATLVDLRAVGRDKSLGFGHVGGTVGDVALPRQRDWHPKHRGACDPITRRSVPAVSTNNQRFLPLVP